MICFGLPSRSQNRAGELYLELTLKDYFIEFVMVLNRPCVTKHFDCWGLFGVNYD